jgi:3-deoxy-manno-octulosonate cytidylyltransferase (CMP-KDO synthetase)
VQDPNSVKVVINNQGLAMYFSRAPIPYPRDGQLAELIAAQPTDSALWHLHVGIYAYRTDFLLKLTSMKPSSLEMTEKLEQLRALQSGAQIAVSVISHAAVGIDTREDYDAFVSRQNVAI